MPKIMDSAHWTLSDTDQDRDVGRLSVLHSFNVSGAEGFWGGVGGGFQGGTFFFEQNVARPA